jgi:hypothetical protein
VARVEAVHTMPDKPLLLCYDGSENAKHAIREAAALLAPRRAVVLTVWQDAAAIPSLAWAAAALPDLEDVFAAARDGAMRMAEEGAGIARGPASTRSPSSPRPKVRSGRPSSSRPRSTTRARSWSAVAD